MLNKTKLIRLFLMLGAADRFIYLCQCSESADALGRPVVIARTVFRGCTDSDSLGHHGGQTRKKLEKWWSFLMSGLLVGILLSTQYCRITFRPVSLENDLYRQWHKHAGLKFLFERKTTEPATSENQLYSDF